MNPSLPLSISILVLSLGKLARRKYLRFLWKIRYPKYFQVKATTIISYACRFFCIRWEIPTPLLPYLRRIRDTTRGDQLRLSPCPCLWWGYNRGSLTGFLRQAQRASWNDTCPLRKILATATQVPQQARLATKLHERRSSSVSSIDNQGKKQIHTSLGRTIYHGWSAKVGNV
jgi:hypothetical protein